MKKAVSCAVAAMMAVTALAGCSSAAPNVSAASKGGEKTTIKVWTINRHDQDYMKAAIEKFNKENKDNIVADYQVYAENFNQSLDIALSTNEGPDVFFDGGTAYTDHLPKGDLAPLDKYLTDSYKKRFGEGVFIEGINMQDGKIYSLPAIGTTPRLFYNKYIFAKAGIANPPATLDEMAADAKLITEKLKKDGIYGFAANLKSPTSALSRSLDYILMRSGGVESGYDFKTGKYDFSSYKPILNAYRDMFVSGAFFPGSISLDIDPLRTQFAAGKIGMYISWTHSEPGVYQNQFPTKEEWDVAPLPTVEKDVKGTQHINLAGRWFLMNAKSKHPDQAWKVMEYLYSDEVLAGYHEQGLGMVMVPSVVAKAKKPDFIQKWPNLEFNDKDQVWPPVPTAVKPEGNDMYFSMTAVITGSTDADKVIADLNTRYNAALDKAVADGKTKRIQYPDFNPASPSKSLAK
ncbi:ABC transporter substrate-binding protein [Paenibacillus sp. YN15]|uniref:ABC transporter substrate-binding protein n=1 Tax=Paenibacillus sp. YN15 TaxID=1742774 RepID=UPI000DCE8483|nr:sugar ABC transporter substrate-binding protein [Paenibacillus sp. YN15]RAV01689.1 ABC transporter substrate-binding protein [Paenibacillus sp. YN15]